MKKKVFLDSEICIKCGTCVALSPDIFKFEDDKVVVIPDALIDKQVEVVQTAIDSCPVGAIKWIE